MNLVFTEHAVDRMAERGILVQEVIEVIASGEVIESYPADKPYPSTLSLKIWRPFRCTCLWATHPTTAR